MTQDNPDPPAESLSEPYTGLLNTPSQGRSAEVYERFIEMGRWERAPEDLTEIFGDEALESLGHKRKSQERFITLDEAMANAEKLDADLDADNYWNGGS